MKWEKYPGFQLGCDAHGLTLRWRLLAAAMDVGFILLFVAGCLLFEVVFLRILWDGGVHLRGDAEPFTLWQLLLTACFAIGCVACAIMAAIRLPRVWVYGRERLRVDCHAGVVRSEGNVLCRTADVQCVLVSYALRTDAAQTLELCVHPRTPAAAERTAQEFIHVAGLRNRAQADALADALGATLGVAVVRREPERPVERSLGFPVVMSAPKPPPLPGARAISYE